MNLHLYFVGETFQSPVFGTKIPLLRGAHRAGWMHFVPLWRGGTACGGCGQNLQFKIYNV